MQSAPVGFGFGFAVAGSPAVTSEESQASDLVVGATRGRQTARPPNPFRDVLAGGVDLLLRGAEVATTVVGGPIMAAAVRGARVNVAPASGSGGVAGAGGLGTSSAGASVGTSPLASSVGSSIGSSLGASGSDATDLATVQAMQRDSQVFNLQLLELQEDVQQENRRFTTVSNVLRAKHDTAKAAVSNIRS